MTTDLKDLREWFRSSDDVRTGLFSRRTFAGKRVTYSVIKGRAVFEGDIVLGPAEAVRAEADEAPATLPARGIGITGERFRWPRSLIPWQTQAPLRQRVLDAIAHWVAKTDMSFVERTAANRAQFPNFVSFRAEDGCWSRVGMQGEEQTISLAAGCGFGAAVHEIGHAVGLWHEQSREDRDQAIRILWENIDAGREHNFNQHVTDGDDIGPYDFGSIMHYGAFAFTKNGQPTIQPLGGQQIGQRRGLSAGDIAAVRVLYPKLEAATGRITMLRVHDVGTKYGPHWDQIDVEVVFSLDSQGSRGFGFQLREGDDEAAHKGMLNLLRSAFRKNLAVTVDYVSEFSNAVVIRARIGA